MIARLVALSLFIGAVAASASEAPAPAKGGSSAVEPAKASPEKKAEKIKHRAGLPKELKAVEDHLNEGWKLLDAEAAPYFKQMRTAQDELVDRVVTHPEVKAKYEERLRERFDNWDHLVAMIQGQSKMLKLIARWLDDAAEKKLKASKEDVETLEAKLLRLDPEAFQLMTDLWAVKPSHENIQKANEDYDKAISSLLDEMKRVDSVNAVQYEGARDLMLTSSLRHLNNLCKKTQAPLDMAGKAAIDYLREKSLISANITAPSSTSR